jgi:hypothetical protein
MSNNARETHRDDDEPLEVDDTLELIVGAMAKPALVE